MMIIVFAVIALFVLYIFIWPIIKGIFIDKEVRPLEAIAEGTTEDCDGDGFIGLSDQCPCDPNKNKLGKGEECGNPDDTDIEKNCPALCKIIA